jgi:hypothetical protein
MKLLTDRVMFNEALRRLRVHILENRIQTPEEAAQEALQIREQSMREQLAFEVQENKLLEEISKGEQMGADRRDCAIYLNEIRMKIVTTKAKFEMQIEALEKIASEPLGETYRKTSAELIRKVEHYGALL